MRTWIALAAACAAMIAVAARSVAEPSLTARSGPLVMHGESPRLLISGLAPRERAVLHSYRLAPQRLRDGPPVMVVAHAVTEFQADRDGRIDVDHAAPLRGTYAGADPLGMFWSGDRSDPVDGVKLPSADDVVFRLERQSRIVAQTRIALTDGGDRVVVEAVENPGLNGAFARPKGAGPWPALILLHGSGGGSREGARALAIRFAQLGYAAFALNYFAPPYARIEGIPRDLQDIPVEVIAKTRTWMQAQPGVRAERVALLGTSKGAELALLAAAHYDWVDRVVACAPSDVVWSGIVSARVAGPPSPGNSSSWTIAGRPLPYIPYDSFADIEQGRLSVAAVHARNLARTPPERVAAARIPIEKTRATLLLLGASKDELWPSGDMTMRIQQTMKSHGLAGQVRALVFEGSGHFFFASVGDQPTRLNPGFKPEGDSPLPDATARASARAWAEIKQFLAR